MARKGSVDNKQDSNKILGRMSASDHADENSQNLNQSPSDNDDAEEEELFQT